METDLDYDHLGRIRLGSQCCKVGEISTGRDKSELQYYEKVEAY